jgi:hypothetical protein
MSGTSSEANVRLEHKLDILIWYLKRLTGEDPLPLERPIPGLNGLTNGVCPITNTSIYLRVNPKSGLVHREDGLATGLVEGAMPPLPDSPSKFKGIMLSDPLGGPIEE